MSPATIYAFKLSGENAAAVAFVIATGVTVRLEVLQFVQINTWFGEFTASEKIAVEVSGEIASTVPNALVNCVAADPVNTMAPFWPKCDDRTPRYAFVPFGSNTNEFGEAGSGIGVPVVKVVPVDDFVNGITVGVQAAFVGFAVGLAHAVVVTYAVGFDGAALLVTVKVIGVFA